MPNQGWNPRALREWHEQLMDHLILHPTATLADLAARFDAHPQTIGVIVRSDLFQARLAERRGAREREVEDTILAKLRGVAETSLDALQTRIQQEQSKLGLGEIRETADLVLKSLGYGTQTKGVPVSNPSAPPVNLQVVVVGREDLARARAMIRAPREEDEQRVLASG